MKRKPWRTSYLLEYEPEDPLPPGDFDGLTILIDSMLKTEKWRCEYWSKHFPDDTAEIVAAVNERTKRLQTVKEQLAVFRCSVAGPESEQQEALAWEFLMMGMAINQATYSWLAYEAEKAVASPVGSLGNKARKVNWKERQERAKMVDDANDCDPLFDNASQEQKDKEAARMLEISVSSLKNWRRGGRR